MTTPNEAQIIDNELSKQLIETYGARLIRELGGPDEFLRHMAGKHIHVARMQLGDGRECGVRVTVEVSREPFPATS